jgi:hypothetical protein
MAINSNDNDSMDRACLADWNRIEATSTNRDVLATTIEFLAAYARFVDDVPNALLELANNLNVPGSAEGCIFETVVSHWVDDPELFPYYSTFVQD